MNFFTFQIYFTGIRLSDTTDSFYCFCTSCTYQTGKAKDLAGANAERYIFEVTCSGKILNFQHLVSEFYFRFREQIFDLTTNHCFDQVCICNSINIVCSDVLGITEYSNSGCQTIHIFKTVGNEDNGNTVSF